MLNTTHNLIYRTISWSVQYSKWHSYGTASYIILPDTVLCITQLISASINKLINATDISTQGMVKTERLYLQSLALHT